MHPWKTLLTAFAIANLAPGLSAQTTPQEDQDYESEIRRIAEEEAVRMAFREIEELTARRWREDLIYLTEIPAPPFREERRARAFAELLREAGADSVWIDEVGNVVALRRGRAPGKVVAIDAHLDTVFPEGTDVTVRERGDTLLAPGIGDDTGGLVLVLGLLRAMNAAGIETGADVLFTGSVGEEGLGDLRGVKHLFREGGPGIDSWISVDGGGEDRVLNQAVGSVRYRVTFRGPGGHSWGAFGLANPHHALGDAVARFARAADAFTGEGPRTSYNVGRIGGGTSVNSVPFESWMEVDMRSLSPARLAGIDSLFHQAVGEALEAQNALRRHGEALQVKVELTGSRPTGTIDPAAPIIQRALAATRFLGIEPELGSGSTNSNTPISMGIPATTIGRGGSSGGTHALDEWILLEGVDLAVKKALLILLAEAGPPPRA